MLDKNIGVKSGEERGEGEGRRGDSEGVLGGKVEKKKKIFFFFSCSLDTPLHSPLSLSLSLWMVVKRRESCPAACVCPSSLERRKGGCVGGGAGTGGALSVMRQSCVSRCLIGREKAPTCREHGATAMSAATECLSFFLL